jgi:hypothetical protein
MRINGGARIGQGDPVLGEFREAQFVVRVRVREVFTDRPHYIHKMRLVERSHFVPEAGRPTPVPG